MIDDKRMGFYVGIIGRELEDERYGSQKLNLKGNNTVETYKLPTFLRQVKNLLKGKRQELL